MLSHWQRRGNQVEHGFRKRVIPLHESKKAAFRPPFSVVIPIRVVDSTRLWRKRVGVEPTIRPAKGRIAGFEGRAGHRTNFASRESIANQPKLASKEKHRAQRTAPGATESKLKW